MTVPTLLDAVQSLNRRKAAAGATEPVHGPALTAVLPILAGTDLNPDEVLEFNGLNARRGMALTLALGTLEASSALWCDGLLTGLEFARLRDQEEGAGARARELEDAARIRALVGALETVKRIVLEAPAGEASRHVTRAVGVIDLMLEGEAEDA